MKLKSVRNIQNTSLPALNRYIAILTNWKRTLELRSSDNPLNKVIMNGEMDVQTIDNYILYLNRYSSSKKERTFKQTFKAKHPYVTEEELQYLWEFTNKTPEEKLKEILPYITTWITIFGLIAITLVVWIVSFFI